MNRTLASICTAAALAAGIAAQAPDSIARRSWPQWRGPTGTGVAPHADPPTEWSESKNIRWKVALPGLGHSSPIVWGDRVYVATAIPFGPHGDPVPDDAPGAHDNAPVTQQHEFAVLAVERCDGSIAWLRGVRSELPHAGAHRSGSLASASPVTDGAHVYASFGSRGLYCLDLDGEVVWEVDLGDLAIKHGHGEGASPVLFGDTIAVNWDHEGESFVVALDKNTGDERWRAPRGEVTSWSTPIVVEVDGVPQLVVAGTRRVCSYDLATGAVVWECGGLSHNIVASPVAADGMVFVGSSYERKALLAIRLSGAKGDITGSDHVVWKRRRRTPYVPSPLLYGKWLYFLAHYQGVLTRVEAATGEEPHGPFRMEGLFDIYASPVGAAGRVYVTDREGSTLVITHGDGAPEILARNELDDRVSASLALIDSEIYLRGERFLYCIAEK